MIEIGIGVALMILASAIHKYVEVRNKGIPADLERRLLEVAQPVQSRNHPNE